MIGSLKRRIPPRLKAAIKRLLYLPLDGLDVLLGKRDELQPPRRLVYIGNGDFKKIGQDFLKHFIEVGQLQAQEAVLDVGCGIGRMAIPLTGYLKNGGHYEGFDVVPDGVLWCQRHISDKYPHFNFRLVDIRNMEYSPKGSVQASLFQFPYDNDSFDFVIVTSVFTHMLPQEVEHYFSEINRVLKTAGRCFATFFLLNAESLRHFGANAGELNFQYEGDGYRMIHKTRPECGLALYEEWVSELYKTNGLRILNPIRYGSWCGRGDFLSQQDIIVAVKE